MASDRHVVPVVGEKEAKLYRGVRKRKWGKYVSEIRLPNSRERIWLGSFDSPEKAARAFDAALFCLRGPHAKFNFPEDPPRIPEANGLGPEDILEVAQRYASGYGNSSSSNVQKREQSDGAEASRSRNIDASPTSNSNDSIDWSFLDTLTYADEYGAINPFDDAGFHEPGDMYTTTQPPYFASKSNDENEDEGGHDEIQHGNLGSFLWNF